VDELALRVARVFERLGLPTRGARSVADDLVESEFCGVHSHGVIHVPTCVQDIRTG